MDWNLESITKRDIRVSDEVVKIMNRWNNEYLNIPISEGKMGEPSEDVYKRQDYNIPLCILKYPFFFNFIPKCNILCYNRY